jgi:redox-sensing transcriptional repressor
MEFESPKMSRLPTIRRLPAYLRVLRQLQGEAWEHVSGTYLAEQLSLDPVQVRKDLTITGIVGTPRVGFMVDDTVAAIEAFLGWQNATEAFLVGVGNLGTALLGYAGFERHGLKIVAAFDADPAKIDVEIHGKPVYPLEKIADLAARLRVRMGILTVPEIAAQAVADRLVVAGITAIWNFTPVALKTPGGVVVQNEDLSCGLAVLSAKLRNADGS